jgi:hypothetical protein
MNDLIRRKKFYILPVMFFFLTACATMDFSDSKEKSSWQVPQRFSTDSVFNASFKAISQGDLEIISHDRKAGFISVKHQFFIPFTGIPSQIPITFSINKSGNRVVLNTTAYLKGIGTGDAYEEIIKNFYDALFLELKIRKSNEQVITKGNGTSEQVITKGNGTSGNSSAGISKDPKVAEVQKMLASKNYNPGPPDGIWGNKTASALKSYQSDNDIPVTGEIDNVTYNSLKGAK